MNEHDTDIIIHPRKTGKDTEIPERGILLVNPGEAKKGVEHLLKRGGSRSFLHNSNLAVSHDECLFVAGPAVGAPVSVMVMEKLIVLGCKSLTLMGWCGGVDDQARIGSVIIPDAAICGEGTSRYYSDKKCSYPSASARKHLVDELEELKPIHDGKIWSTDAPYRESKTHLESLHRKDNVKGVDMEFSALCTVAAFREIDFAGVLIVSDELMNTEWKPGFKSNTFKSVRDQVFQKLLRIND